MKKLMITLCAVAMAALSQAASIKWTAADISTVETQGKTETTALSGALYYCFLATDPAGGASTEGQRISVADATALARKGDLAALAAKAIVTGYTSSMGSIASAEAGSYAKGADRPTGFAIIIDTDSASDAEYFMVTGVSTAGSFSKDTTVAKIALGSQESNEWQEIESVPEPFSGALALLGMGAIALRRKMKKAKKA